jgi:hypothetical protein
VETLAFEFSMRECLSKGMVCFCSGGGESCLPEEETVKVSVSESSECVESG